MLILQKCIPGQWAQGDDGGHLQTTEGIPLFLLWFSHICIHSFSIPLGFPLRSVPVLLGLLIEIGKRPDKKFGQGFIGTPSAIGVSENNRFPCLLPEGGERVPYIG